MPKLTIAEGTASFEVTVLVLESTLCSNVVLFAVGAGGNVERLFRFSLSSGSIRVDSRRIYMSLER
jgi:hypothetical protein